MAGVEFGGVVADFRFSIRAKDLENGLPAIGQHRFDAGLVHFEVELETEESVFEAKCLVFAGGSGGE